MPTPRKLHTALAELEGRQAAVSPTVAAELARDGDRPTLIDGISAAEYALKTKHDELSAEDGDGLERDARACSRKRSRPRSTEAASPHR